MAWAWLARKVRQLWLGGRDGPAAPVTANGACGDGDAALKRGRPRERPDRQRQNRLQPWRRHRSTVSGRTKTRSPRQFRWRRRTKSQKSLSRARRRGRCRERRATWSCGRRSRFSMRRRWRLRRTLAVWRGRAREVRSSGAGSPIDAPREEERRLLPSYSPRWTSAAVTYFSRQR
jgi:hypothetical protein